MCGGSELQRPSVETPLSWRFEKKEAREVANTAWWEQFDDPVLNELIQIALKENKNLKIAAARVEEFMGGGWVSVADHLTGTTTDSKISRDGKEVLHANQ